MPAIVLSSNPAPACLDEEPIRLHELDIVAGRLTTVSEGEDLIVSVGGILVELPGSFAEQMRSLSQKQIWLANVGGQIRVEAMS